jgi:hypothetical protein
VMVVPEPPSQGKKRRRKAEPAVSASGAAAGVEGGRPKRACRAPKRYGD